MVNNNDIHLMWDDAVLTIAPSNRKLEKFLTYKEKSLEPDPKKPWNKITRVKTVDLYTVIKEQPNYRVIQTMQGMWHKVKTFLENDGFNVKFYDMRLSFPAPKFELMHGFRFSQEALIKQFLSTNCSGLLGAPTRFGKGTLMKNTIRAFPDVNTVVTVPGTDLVKQLYEEVKEANPGREVVLLGGGSTKKYNGADITVASMDSLHKCDTDMCRLLVIDECFTPDVEVLTENGFVRFDNLQDGIKCAQVNTVDQALSFIAPSHIIKNQFSGNLIRVKCDRLCDLSMTPNHELVLCEHGKWFKKSVKEANFRGSIHLASAGFSTCVSSDTLTPHERLMIALQADGSIHHVSLNGDLSLVFSFRKERKIKRFFQIMEDGKYVWSEVKAKPKDRRFIVTGIQQASKNLQDHFKIYNIGLNKAKALIDEIVEWDGHKHSDSSWYYSSTVEANTDFVQSICVLAGYKSNKTIQVDARSDTFNDVHRLFIQKNRHTFGSQAIHKYTEAYTGLVYCVRVPEGNIVVRRNGKPVVVGNCHAAVTASRLPDLAKFDKARKLGFGATLKGRFDCRDILIEALIGPVLAERTYTEAVEEGAICPLVVYMIRIPILKSVDTRDRAYKNLLFNNDRIGKAVKWICHELLPKNWQTILFIKNESQAEFYMDWIGKVGTIAMAKRMSTPERRDTMERMASGDIKRCIASDIYSQGVTFNHVRALINLSGGGANTTTIQKPGRLAEIRPGKNCGIIFDFMFVPETGVHDLKGAQCLVRDSVARLTAYLEKGYEVRHISGYEELVTAFNARITQ